MSAKPYNIHIKQDVIDDLHQRLDNIRWPDSPKDIGGGYGADPALIKELAKYWRTHFDWRKAEAKLNEFDNFTAEVNGVELHFVHQKSSNPNATPLLLIHGWPDSFYRFHKVIPMLAENFDVIVPSLPGFGFSDHTAMASAPTADLLAALMTDVLGYEKFAVSSGDIGTEIVRALGNNHAEAVTGLHLTDAGFPTGTEDFSTMSPAEQAFAGKCQQWWYMEGAYNMLQSTKPQTLAYGLEDSPVGILAWIAEKFQAWTDNDGDLEKVISKDELLTNIMLYWATGTIASSLRTYAENTRAVYAQGPPKPAARVKVPTSFAIFPGEMVPAVREWAARNFNVVTFNEQPKGGHFAAMEVPELFAKDVTSAFKK